MALNELLETLEQMEVAHRRMLELGEQKRTAIMQNDVDRLIAIANQESKLVKAIGTLDDRRADEAHAFMQTKGIKSKLNLTITELARLVFDLDEKARLLDVQQRLASALSELKLLNETNQQLIQQSLSFINFSIDVMVGAPEDNYTYTHPSNGYSATTRNPGFFNARG
ncbi:flagellar protein FlgN [Saccharibacillus sp. CPCC 101409]|uniref:flagellar protein FlgN n=1 Tax=Saccharibacillus sp. CPCC 101409 TaxID=3058041 RepID=UPI0026741092|nr:flagellar protein FlgN [Saccharibacillus sp. CPCC 101409]MDO3412085.1 flagellar protein FlgN [Saccharibacillus sp. CPCC 101409]